MCKKPKMPPMPEMPIQRAPERAPDRSAVRVAQSQDTRAQMGAARPAARILGNTARMGSQQPVAIMGGEAVLGSSQRAQSTGSPAIDNFFQSSLIGRSITGLMAGQRASRS